MTAPVSHERLERAYATARTALLDELTADGHWTGELSTSALSTATAVMAFELARRAIEADGRDDRVDQSAPPDSLTAGQSPHDMVALIRRGIEWLAEHQNDDGGWGDTVKSISNISTTMLAHAAFHATNRVAQFSDVVSSAQRYIDRAGSVDAVLNRYGKDRTFSIPILTHCALAGLADWNDVIALPFELACFPSRFYKALRFPVVSYALPALIAIGQVRHHFLKPRNPLIRLIRDLTKKHSLHVLIGLQPENGGFLEAAPLTSFVTMSLVAMGHLNHPVAQKGLAFLRDSVRPDGSWPIDTNLATWTTTLSINALQDSLPAIHRPELTDWLLRQQYRVVHPYTQAAPGGWAWTDLPGGVPDTDDTPGAMLALMNLRDISRSVDERISDALNRAVRWLLDLQNGDGGWPTFCRGWGTQPFDRSAPDLTAHVLRALNGWRNDPASDVVTARHWRRVDRSIERGFRFLGRAQRPDGTWLPLWFGNQHAPNDENPTYGTARVLAAFRDVGVLNESAAAAITALLKLQNKDGGWSGHRGLVSSVEETALATESLLCGTGNRGGKTAATWTQLVKEKSVALGGQVESSNPLCEHVYRGLAWLLDRVDDGRYRESSPIGFYFAKLWYFERLYPLVFTVAALGRARADVQ